MNKQLWRNEITKVSVGLIGLAMAGALLSSVAVGATASKPQDNGTGPMTGPMTKQDCRDKGWQGFSEKFKNQGACISHVERHHKDNGYGDENENENEGDNGGNNDHHFKLPANFDLGSFFRSFDFNSFFRSFDFSR